MPTFKDTLPRNERSGNPPVEEGSYDMTFLGFGKPYEGQFEDPNTGAKKWQLKAYYQFDQNKAEFFEYLGATTFDGVSKRGDAKPSKLFQRLRVLAGVKNQEEADRLEFDALKDIPIVGTFIDDGVKVRLMSIKLRKGAKPAAKAKSELPDYDQGDDSEEDPPF